MSQIKDMMLRVAFLLFDSSRSRRETKQPETMQFEDNADDFDTASIKTGLFECVRPGEETVDLANLLNSSFASDWIGKPLKEAVQMALKAIIHQLRKEFRWLIICAVPCSSRSTRYPRLPQAVFLKLAEIIQIGFRIERKALSTATIVSMAKRKMRNYISRERTGQMQRVEKLLNKFWKRYPKWNETVEAYDAALDD
ncbi:unnamed protein product [Caenorhabditis bovis]|uniref:Uncharacterized protein n=1 Tax=Caenorhabditis bovis TaxID=2654633 RepID=A0A8S1F4M0_9PELO|nr:unnamed protein product [Caenorhabditis bovis]